MMDRLTEKNPNTEQVDVAYAEPKIDWNQWHKPIQESLRAFDVSTTAAICKRLGITFSCSDYSMNVTCLRDWVEDVCEGLAAWHITGNHYKATNVNTYCEEDTGILVGEIQLHSSIDAEDDVILSPIIQVKLRKMLPTDENPNPWWFDISFILASQVF